MKQGGQRTGLCDGAGENCLPALPSWAVWAVEPEQRGLKALDGLSYAIVGRPIRSSAMMRTPIRTWWCRMRAPSTARFGWPYVVLLLSAMAAGLLYGPAQAVAQGGDGQAQQYLEIRDVDPPSRNEIRELKSAMRNGSIPNRDIFQRWYTYRVAEFTWPEKRSQLHRLRTALFRTDLQQANDDAYKALNAFLLDKMQTIASDDRYHPAVRLNAVLILGQLDAEKPDFSGRNFVPLPEALPPLLAIATAETKGAIGDTLAVGALKGILRQVSAERKAIDTDQQKNIAQAMLALLKRARLPHRNAAVDGWIRRRAAQVIRVLDATGGEVPTGEVVEALLTMAGDESLSVTVRCAATETLGHLKLADVAQQIDAKAWLTPLAKLAHGVMQEESSVGAMVFYLESIQTALLGPENKGGGLTTVAQGDVATQFKSLAEHIDNVVQQLVQYGIDEPDLPEDFEEMQREFEQSISAMLGPEKVMVGEDVSPQATTKR